VHHVAQTHRASQAGTALEGVQVAQHLGPGARVVGSSLPLPQGCRQAGQDLMRLVFKHRKQIDIESVDWLGG